MVSVLAVASNTRPQQSSGVASFEFLIPERVRTLSLDRFPKTP